MRPESQRDSRPVGRDQRPVRTGPAERDGDSVEDPFAEQRARVDAPIRRLFGTYGRHHVGVLAVGQLAGVLARFAELLPPLILGIAIDAVFLQTGPFAVWFLPTWIVPPDRAGQFWLAAGLIAGSFGLAAVFNWVRGWGLNTFAQRIQHEVRTDAYDHIQRLDMAFFDDHQTGELMSILAGDANNLEQFLNGGMEGITRLTVLVGGIAVLMVSINSQLALVALIPVPFIGLYTYRYVRAVEPRYAATRSKLADLYARLENNLNGIQVVKTAGTEGFERDRVEGASRTYVETNWAGLRLAITRLPMLRVLAGVGFVLTFVVGGVWVFSGPPLGFSGTLSVGEFVTFVLLSQQLVQPMADFGTLIDQYQKAKVSAARVFGIVDEPAEPDDEGRPLDEVDGHVEYDDVEFGYGPTRILRGIDLTVPAGATVAFVGPSGSGKSTAMKLLPRMYEPDAGLVSVDGNDLATVRLDSLRGSIGYVGQEPYLFSGTIRENIAYGTPDVSEEAIQEAARRANAHEFIGNLPDGYESQVGQRGGKLSGGQRQRISIARTILKDPEILLLDEATSAVDTETELVIQRSIEDLAADRTTVAIAHRLSTIRDADQVLVFEDGRIRERGTHEELLDADGLYAHLWQIQVGALDELPSSFFERVLHRTAEVTGD